MVRRRWLYTGRRRRGRRVACWVRSVRLDFTYDRRHGFRLVAFAVMVDGPRGRHAGPEVSCDMPKKPDQSQANGTAVHTAAAAPRWFDKTPVLSGYLRDMQYEDGGGAREPSYLLVKAAGGEWLITLKDPTEARQLRVRVSDLMTMFGALEALLTSGTCPWEPDAWAASRSKKKR